MIDKDSNSVHVRVFDNIDKESDTVNVRVVVNVDKELDRCKVIDQDSDIINIRVESDTIKSNIVKSDTIKSVTVESNTVQSDTVESNTVDVRVVVNVDEESVMCRRSKHDSGNSPNAADLFCHHQMGFVVIGWGGAAKMKNSHGIGQKDDCHCT